jgi:hypothetical protein
MDMGSVIRTAQMIRWTVTYIVVLLGVEENREHDETCRCFRERRWHVFCHFLGGIPRIIGISLEGSMQRFCERHLCKVLVG